MAEHVAEYEWRGEGEEAEIVLYAPDDPAFERAMPVAKLPGAESPVYAAASPQGFGWAASSATHAAPDLLSVPISSLLLDPTRPPGGADVQPSRSLAQHPPQHPHSSGGAGVGEVGGGVKCRDEILGLTTAGRGCREFRRSAEVSRPHSAQNALLVGNEREPAEVSCVDLYDKGEGSLLQSQAFRAFGVQDLRHQPEIWFHLIRPLALSGG